MVFAGLLVSLGVVALTWLVVTMAECGLTIGMLITFPFVWLVEKIKELLDTRTEEEKQAEFEEYKKQHYNEHLNVWVHW